MKEAEKFIKESETRYIVSFIPKGGGRAFIKAFGTRTQANDAVSLLYLAALAEKAERYYRVNYASVPDCPHYQDNQGLCHNCGLTLCGHTAKESRFYQEEK
jgi:hypothetical protein